ncbi:MAG: hypothetical protein HYT87_07675 [Nitrospirae bacterium]|nr:hypothetical protein [Nitrospirota bacterium]
MSIFRIVQLATTSHLTSSEIPSLLLYLVSGAVGVLLAAYLVARKRT